MAQQAPPPDEDALNFCPRCGSGNITGGSDGSITCGFCEFVFKVFMQPTHPFTPQMVNGQPYVSEDGSTRSDTPTPAAGGVVDPMAPGAASPVPGGPPGIPSGIEKFRVDQPVSTPPIAPEAALGYRTASGKVLPEDSYIAHLAIAHAEDRDAVIDEVRASRGK